MYKLLYHPRCKKFLKKIPKKDSKRIVEKIDEVCENPFSESLNIKKLADTKNSYRLRVGNIRIVYEVDTLGQKLFVADIDFRGNIY